MQFVLIAIAVIIIILLVTNIHVVQQSRAFVVERLGGYHATWGVGLHVKVPILDRIAKRVSLKEQVVDFAPQPVITKDNVTMQIDTVIYFQIVDPKLYTYGVEQPLSAIENTYIYYHRRPGAGPVPSPAGTTSTPRCVPFWTRPRTPGASRSTGWS